MYAFKVQGKVLGLFDTTTEAKDFRMRWEEDNLVIEDVRTFEEKRADYIERFGRTPESVCKDFLDGERKSLTTSMLFPAIECMEDADYREQLWTTKM
jgi:hypothetical protein